MLKTAKQWCEITGIQVLDPDGWDRSNPKFLEIWNTHKISFNEFWNRVTNSTVNHFRGDKDAVWGDVLGRWLRGEIQDD